MDEHTDARHHQISHQEDNIVHLQTLLARRLLLIFFIPLLVIVVLGVYAYRLSGRVHTLEALQQINFIERIMQKSHSHAWAISEYQQVAERYPHPQVFVRLGALYFEGGNSKDALDMLERAKGFDPDYWEIYSTAAYIYLQQKDVTKTIEAGKQALKLNPRDAQTYNNLAWLYATNDEVLDLSKARDYALQAVAYTRARDLDCIDTLVEVYMKTGQIDHAIEMIEASIKTKVADAEYFQVRLNDLQAYVRKE